MIVPSLLRTVQLPALFVTGYLAASFWAIKPPKDIPKITSGLELLSIFLKVYSVYTKIHQQT